MSAHHPSEATLLAYATGALATPHAQVVALHIGSCAHCAEEVRLLEAVGGALLDDLSTEALSPDALERVTARLDGQPSALRSMSFMPLSKAVDTLTSGRWRWCGPGVHMMPLIKRDAADTRLDLIRVAPGMALLNR